MMTLAKIDFALRPETTLGQVWETVRQWVLNSPYSRFKKVPQMLPTKISEGDMMREKDGDWVELSRVGDGMQIVSFRERRSLKWRTVMMFTRQKRSVKCRVEVMLDGTIPAGVPLELKTPRVIKNLKRVYGIEKREKSREGRQTLTEHVTSEADRVIAVVKKREKAERGLMTNSLLANLFGVNRNTISNWIHGKTSAPEGFREAYDNKLTARMGKIAELYKLNRNKAADDALNKNRTVYNMSEEAISRRRLHK